VGSQSVDHEDVMNVGVFRTLPRYIGELWV